MAEASSQQLIKLVLIGDSGVGKSCVLLRFADDAFASTYITTIGVDFRFKTISVNNKMIKLQIWDTAGQERFRTITSAYYRGADGIIIVYDTTSRDSFLKVDDWIAEVDRCTNEKTSKILIGNKCDDISFKAVSTEEGQKKANELGILFAETSAKTGQNVDMAFQLVTDEIVTRNPRKKAAKGDYALKGEQDEKKTGNKKQKCQCG